jgi:gliding motility-associated lipoprotein GldD
MYKSKVYGLQFRVLFMLLLGLLVACNEDYAPKPKAYPRIDFPAHSYQNFNHNDCPFSFDYPTYAKVAKDDIFLNGQTAEHPCWMNIEYPNFKASLHVSYKDLNGRAAHLPELVNDAYKMNAKHVLRADFIDDSVIATPNNVKGVYYDVGGDAASSTQFFLTDSAKHFIWAALYINATPNQDSLAPVIQFIRKDIKHLIDSFVWTE